MKPVQEAKRAKVDIELLMMLVVRFRQRSEEVVSTMSDDGFSDTCRPEDEAGNDMTAKKIRW